MRNEVINHMAEDELRNYVKHQDKLVNASLEVNSANQDLVYAWRQLVIAMEHQQDSLLDRNNRLNELRGLEKELEQKYDEFKPYADV